MEKVFKRFGKRIGVGEITQSCAKDIFNKKKKMSLHEQQHEESRN